MGIDTARRTFLFAVFRLATCGSLLTIPGCGLSDRGSTEEDSPPPTCQEESNFSNEVYPLLRSRCAGCHAPGLPGGATAFVLATDATGDYSMVKGLVTPGKPTESYLLMKASGQTSHGGGAILAESSGEYRIVSAWISLGACGN
ncbi:MAG: hypothetical protein HYT87_03055 [Nitrospirae bacterium]|nr:hypothetical protein [Nitrospirota bacterium]